MVKKKIEDVYFLRKAKKEGTRGGGIPAKRASLRAVANPKGGVKRRGASPSVGGKRRPLDERGFVFPKAKKVQVEPLPRPTPKETVDITPLLSYDIDDDGLPSVESIRGNPEILQRVSPQVRAQLINKLRGRTEEENIARQAQIAVPTQLGRLRQNTIELRQAIEDLPRGLRDELAPTLENLSQKIEGIGQPTPKPVEEPTPEPEEEQPPSYELTDAEKSRGMTQEESTLKDRLSASSGTRKLSKNLNALFGTPGARSDTGVKLVQKLSSRGLRNALRNAEDVGRTIDPKFRAEIEKIISEKEASGSGLRASGPPAKGVRASRGRRVAGVSERDKGEIASGKNIGKHFERFMSLAKKHKKVGKLTEKESAKLKDYSELSGKGFFDDVFNKVGTFATKILDKLPGFKYA